MIAMARSVSHSAKKKKNKTFPFVWLCVDNAAAYSSGQLLMADSHNRNWPPKKTDHLWPHNQPLFHVFMRQPLQTSAFLLVTIKKTYC